MRPACPGPDIGASPLYAMKEALPGRGPGMPPWQDKLFIYLMKNAANPTEFFRIPPGRVVEMGARVTV